MKRFTALLLLLALTLTGCAGDSAGEAYVPTGDALFMEGDSLADYLGTNEEKAQQLTLAYFADRTINPILSGNFTNRVLCSLIYQGLFSVDNDYNVTPILCSAYQVSPSNMTYTFYIEQNATFSDGTRLTIQDVLASYEAARQSTYYKGRFTHITAIALTDDGGIRFSLNTPYANLPLLLDIPIVKASEVEADVPLGTGPYIFDQSLSGAHLRRNLNWWCDVKLPVRADSISLVEAEDPSQIRDEFEFYDVGLVCTDPCSDSYADYRCDYELWNCDNGVMLYIGCNTRYSEYFEDGDLQAVLTYAIDRVTINEENYNGYGQPSTLAASPSSPYYNSALAEKYAYDPMKFIAAVGSMNLPKEPLRLLVNKDDSARVRTARDIAATLTELGLETVTEEYTTLGYNQMLTNCNYDIYLGQTRLSANMDLSPFFAPWGNLSWGGMDDAGEIYSTCLDALENEGNYYNLLQQVAEDGRMIPVLFGNYNVYATRGLLTDLTPSRDNVFYYSLGKTMSDIQLETDYS